MGRCQWYRHEKLEPSDSVGSAQPVGCFRQLRRSGINIVNIRRALLPPIPPFQLSKSPCVVLCLVRLYLPLCIYYVRPPSRHRSLFTPRHYVLQGAFLTAFPFASPFGVQHPTVPRVTPYLIFRWPCCREYPQGHLQYFLSLSKCNFLSHPRLPSNLSATNPSLRDCILPLPLPITIPVYHLPDVATSDVFILGDLAQSL